MAVNIFTGRETPLPISPSKVLEFLAPFALATLSYLEYSILNEATAVCV